MIRVAIVRGAFLNNFEMQNYNFLQEDIKITAFSSKNPIHKEFSFETVKLPSLYVRSKDTYGVSVSQAINFLANRAIGDSQILFGLERYLSNFDIVHTADPHYYYSYQAARLRFLGKIKKLVVTSWETIPFNNESVGRKKANKYFVLEHADCFLCYTQQAKDCLIKEGVNANKIFVIPLGVELQKFSPYSKKNSENLSVLFVGRLVEEKGVLDLYNAFTTLPHPRYILEIVGEGPLKKILTQNIKRDSLDSYINLQQRSYQDMPRVYKEADIFVLPSKKTKTWEEQYGMVLIEAMASGLPILASKSGAIPEVVGDTAILFEEGNVEQLRSALLKADDKKVREQYSRKALERSKKYFDAEEVSKSIYRFYCKTLGL